MPSTINGQSKNDDSVLLELLAPDGYYRYLGVTKPMAEIPSTTNTSSSQDKDDPSSRTSGAPASNSSIDEDLVKKNYRKLSLKHHPDKGGNADTFRVLNRAQRVLLDPKLRKQYDIVGIDLDDDDLNKNDDMDHDSDDPHKDPSHSSSQGIVQEIASNVLAGVLQLGIRTLIMGSVSVVIVRYRWTLYPALAFLAYNVYRIIQLQRRVTGGSLYDTIPPTMIAAGLLCMSSSAMEGDGSWNTKFWIGEAIVIGMFLYNSLSHLPIFNIFVGLGLSVFSLLLALWFRGRIWNYGIVVVIIGIVAILVALAFPIMELIIESILNEKLKKVGDKVRQHHQLVMSHYERKT